MRFFREAGYRGGGSHGLFFPSYPKAPAVSYINRVKRYPHDRGITISGAGVKHDFATADKAVCGVGVGLTKVWLKVVPQPKPPGDRKELPLALHA